MYYDQSTSLYYDHGTSCTMMIVHACTMLIVHACIFIIVRAHIMIIAHARTMIIGHVSCPIGLMFGEIQSGGAVWRSPLAKQWALRGRHGSQWGMWSGGQSMDYWG